MNFKKLQVYEASDGTLFKTEKEIINYEMKIYNEKIINQLESIIRNIKTGKLYSKDIENIVNTLLTKRTQIVGLLKNYNSLPLLGKGALSLSEDSKNGLSITS